MNPIIHYLLKVGIFLDQGINYLIFGGDEDEMISSRVYREKRLKWVKVIDFIIYPFQKDHCHECFEYEKIRRRIPFGERD